MSFSQWKKELTGYDCEQSQLSQHQDGFTSRAKWLPVPASLFNETLLVGTGEPSLYTNADWTFPVLDEGALTWVVDNPMEQLRVDINSGTTTAAGFTMVYGNPNAVFRRSFNNFTPLPARGRQEARLPPSCQLWLSYQHGAIEMGYGKEIGQNVFLSAVDGQAAPCMRQVWFGGWANPDCRRTRISQVQFYRLNRSTRQSHYETHCPS